METWTLFLILACLPFVGTLSVSAIDTPTPLRTGNIYVVIAASSFSTTASVVFDAQLAQTMQGVVLSPRVYQYQNASALNLRYSFSPGSTSATGFTMNINLNNAMFNYSYVIVSYFAGCSNANVQFKTLLSSTGAFLNSGVKKTYAWNYNSNLVYTTSAAVSRFYPSVVSLGWGSASNTQFLMTVDHDIVVSMPGAVVNVTLTINSQTTVSTVVLNGFSYQLLDFPNNLTLTLESFSSNQLSSSSITRPGPLIFTFVGIRNMIMSGTIGVSFSIQPNTYSSTHPENSYYQQNPPTMMVVSPIGPSDPNYVFTILQIYRTQCNGAYPYLDYDRQLCYDQCPLGTYVLAGVCKSCFSCTDLNVCGECFTNGCAVGQYFSTSFTCVACSSSIQGCLECSSDPSTLNCTLCDHSLYYALSNNVCNQCNTTAYYNQSNFLCYSCDSTISECATCSPLNGGTCLSCYNSKVVSNNLCVVPCSAGTYFDTPTQLCYSCLDDCTQCPSYSFCSICMSQIGSIAVCGNLHSSLRFEVNKRRANLVQCKVGFSINSSQVLLFYDISMKINDITVNFTSQVLPNTAKGLLITIGLMESYPSLLVEIIFTRRTAVQVLDEESAFDTLNDVMQMNELEMKFQWGMNKAMSFLNWNFATIYTSLSISGNLAYIISLMWIIGVVSMYLYLPVNKPMNLEMFLNATSQMSNVQLLPFSIATPLENSDYQVRGDELYEAYQFDLFFMRSNITTIIETCIFILLFLAVYLVFSRLQHRRNSNIIVYLLNRRFHKMGYANMSTNLNSIVVQIGFSASACLTSAAFKDPYAVMNYSSALLILVGVYVVMMIEPMYLFFQKKDKSVDNEDCYTGGKRKYKFSEMYLLVSNLLVTTVLTCVPHMHPLLTLILVMVIVIVNISFLFKEKYLKIRLCSYIRAINKIFFALFNLIFIVLYLINKHFEQSYNQMLAAYYLGYIAIASLILILFLEVLEMVLDIIKDVYVFITVKLCKRLRRPQTENHKEREKEAEEEEKERKQEEELEGERNEKEVTLELNPSLEMSTGPLISCQSEIRKPYKRRVGIILQNINLDEVKLQLAIFKRSPSTMVKHDENRLSYQQPTIHEDRSQTLRNKSTINVKAHKKSMLGKKKSMFYFETTEMDFSCQEKDSTSQRKEDEAL